MRAIGIILAGGNNKRMGELTQKRALPAMPVAGSYRAIDFALSNMTNSQVKRVAVITQYNSLSLNEHLISSKWWNFGRKQGGLIVFTPSITPTNANWYRGTADSMVQNIRYLKEAHEPYVVIASGDCVYKMDYNDVLEYHIAKNADITMVCKKMPEGTDLRRFGLVKTDEDGRVTDIDEKPMVATSDVASLGIYVMRRRLLIELLEQCAEEDRYDFVRDILIRYKNLKKIYSYQMDTYWGTIGSVGAYYQTNMDFLKPEVRDYFFHQYPDVYCKVDDNPPAKYNPGSNIRGSLIASGAILNGTVESSVLFKEVFVGKGATVKNSVILNDVTIGEDCVIEYCIVESHNTIKAGSKFIGTPDKIRVVTDRDLTE